MQLVLVLVRFFLTVACVEPGKIHRVGVPHEFETHGGTVRFFKKLPVASAYTLITTYLAALQFHVANTFNSPYTIWHKGLHQVLKGFLRIQTIEAPIFNKTKLPFTRDLIQYAQHHVLGTTPTDEALHAALCLGFMFLLR